MPEGVAQGEHAVQASAAGTTPGQAGPDGGTEQDGRQQPGRAGWLARTRGLIRQNWLFCVALVPAAALRVVVMLGYPPVMWFNDSYSYVSSTVHHATSTARPAGYPMLLLVLKPLHSFAVVAGLQHLLGLGVGVAVYALLRRRGLPAWGAVLAAVPALFDAYEVQVEQQVMSDTLFVAVLGAAVVLLCWNDKISVRVAVVAGLLIGYANLVRSAGLPLLVVVAVCLLARRVGWRPVVALIGAMLVPLAGYMFMFHVQHGSFALTDSDGIFLYGRVQSFADCNVIKPPASLRVLCDSRPPAQRPIAVEYIWAPGGVMERLGPDYTFFNPKINGMAQKFAEQALLAQPLSYLKAVGADTLRSFTWQRSLSYDTKTNILYQFSNPPPQIRPGKLPGLRLYQPDLTQARAVQPWAGFVARYQDQIYLRGTLLGLILVAGLAGVIARWRRWGGLVLMPWLIAVALLILPIATSGFSYRYELAVIPFACLAAGLAAVRAKRAG